ncbi:MAG: pyridoxal phosphate-dependent aminotransferase [Bacteroidales bacterium]|jgi:aspartate/methionine/tyrosine aminotransferase|nr:pyridoxal phosphate-dependent aminotransferase [Bacteroidales bacterium]
MQQSWISYFSNLVKENGGINLAQGIPGFQPPKALLNELQKQSVNPVHQYAPGLGNSKLRAHIATEFQDKIPADFEFMITLGGTEAIQLLYLYLHKKHNGLKAAAFSPVYESYMHLPRIYGDQFKSIPIEKPDLQTRLTDFFTQYKPQVFFVNTPGNPYGKALSEEDFNLLQTLCNQYNCYLIIDAVYDVFHFGKAPYYPFKHFSDKTFYVNSFSKRYSITGWRLGYFFAHQSHFEQISDIHDYTGLSCPSVLQESLANFLDIPNEAHAYVESIRLQLQENYQHSENALNSKGFFIPEIHGGYYIWTKLPEHCSDGLDFAKSLYAKRKTAVIPGVHFGDAYSNYIRINIAREPVELKAGIEAICRSI